LGLLVNDRVGHTKLAACAPYRYDCKVVPTHDKNAWKKSRDIAPCIIDLGSKMEVSVLLHCLTALYSGKKHYFCGEGSVNNRADLDIFKISLDSAKIRTPDRPV
jgi:hypothetical protein